MATTDEIISVDEVKTSPRGRKPELDATLVAALAAVKPGQAIRLSKRFGNVEADDRQTVGATIRKHWKAAFGESDAVKPRIDFTPEGVPQVRFRNAEAAGKVVK